MNYGYFDDCNKEYVITRPDTPTPWSNYLGSMEYGALITNNAAGYSFVKSGSEGRILRFRFNSVTQDMPGRFIYIKDQNSGDYWSASWQPTGKELSDYKSVCRHGTAYTVISSDYDKISSETLYYVPLGQNHEVWHFKIRNNDTKRRKISVFSYAEFTSDNSSMLDMENIQYTRFLSRTYFKDNYILQSLKELTEERVFRFFAASGGVKVSGYDGSREKFVGPYGSYSNPLALKNGYCSNSLNYTGNSCGSLQIDLDLLPGTEKEIVFILGEGNEETAEMKVKHYKGGGVVEEELAQLKAYWHGKLEVFQVKTPDSAFNSMMNVWHSYECFVNTFWSRTASLIYSSLRNGFGYRDTMADIQSIMHLDSKLAGERLVTMLSGQVSNGGALPLVRFDHKPGAEPVPGSSEYQEKTGYKEYRCDDALWLFQAVPQYIRESGELDFLNKIIPYSDKGEDTVYLHLKKALNFSLERLGQHNLVRGIDTDWNDCLRLGENGESVFASFQLYLAICEFKKIALSNGNCEDVDWAETNRKKLYDSLQKYCWDDGQFIRGFTGDNQVIGSPKSMEAALWLNPQTWSVISGVATHDQAKKALDKVHDILKTKYGAMLFYPSTKTIGPPIFLMSLYPPGIKENASIFLMAEAWIIQAEAMMGHGNRAWDYYNSTNPAAQNDSADLRHTEPYVYSQFIDGLESPNHGRSHGHWLTGSASSIMTAVVEEILGLKADYDGLIIDPCIPSEWKEFSMVRHFRGRKLNIIVQNPGGVEKGVKKISINDKTILNSCLIPLDCMEAVNAVQVIMG